MSEQPTPAPTAPADPPVDDGPAPSTTGGHDATAAGPAADDAGAAAAGQTAPPDPAAGGGDDGDVGDVGDGDVGDGDAAADPGSDRPPEAVGDAPADEAPADEAPADEPPAPPRRRVTLAGGILAVLLALLGFTLVAQVRSVNTDPSLPAARQEELVRILADLDAHEQRLRQEIAEQEEILQRLTTAGESRQEALEEATRRADELGVLAGILPVKGPGLTVEIHAGPEPISAARLLDAVQELRGAGAEAIQITDGAGTAVRVVASTYFVDEDGGMIRADGKLLRSPYTVTVIGDPATLRPALAIPGGVVESVQSGGGTVTLHEHPEGVDVTAVREPAPLQYANPVS
jgi:uncharacterized protein YlxW (UPF0749 family)